jgi:hypothetical protein
MVLVAQRHGLRAAELVDLRWDQVRTLPARGSAQRRESLSAEHRELIAEAAKNVDRWTAEGLFGKRRANLLSAAQTPKA